MDGPHTLVLCLSNCASYPVLSVLLRRHNINPNGNVVSLAPPCSYSRSLCSSWVRNSPGALVATSRLAWILDPPTYRHRYVKCTEGSWPVLDRFMRGYHFIWPKSDSFLFFRSLNPFASMLHFVKLGPKTK